MSKITNERKSQLTWIWNRTKIYHSHIALCIFIDLAIVVFGLLAIYGSKKAIDIAVGDSSGDLYSYCVLIIASLILSIIAGLVASWLAGCVRMKLRMDIQNSLVNVLMLSSWKSTGKWHTGDLMVRLEVDCEEVVQMVVVTVPLFIVTCVKLCTSFGFLWVMDPLLAGMILGVSPLFLLSKFYYRRMRALSKEVKKADSRFGTILQENLGRRLLIRSLEVVDSRNEKIRRCQQNRYGLGKHLLKFSTWTQGAVKLTFGIGYLVAFLWGVYRLSVGAISFGTLTVFMQLVGRVQSPILSTVTFLPSTIRFRTSLERLTELYESESELKQEPELKATLGSESESKFGSKSIVGQCVTSAPLSLKIEDVSFRYEENEVISHFTAEFRPGVPTAIVGPTGRGKTTLIRLILALIPPEAGKLWLCDGTRDYPVSTTTRAHFAYVPQGNTLFSGSIRENLLLVSPKASEKQLRDALQIACVDFIESLPQGMDTWIGESGYGLSEGQAQRVAIARAILRDSSVWIFDEITSALDPDTARRLIQNLLEVGKEKTVLFVTHDPQIADACARVVKLDGKRK